MNVLRESMASGSGELGRELPAAGDGSAGRPQTAARSPYSTATEERVGVGRDGLGR